MAVVDFTTYTEVDPASSLTVTSTKIDAVSNDTQDNAYVYKDMGVDHFAGDFTHYFEFYGNSTSDAGQRQNFWGMANGVGEQESLDLASTAFFCWSWGDEGANTLRRLYEGDAGTEYTDTDGGNTTVGYNTLYYAKVVRDEAVGTYGTLYMYIYSDSGRTSLLESQSLTLHTSKKDFRYIYGEMNDGRTQAGVVTGYTQNLDLNESVSVTVTPATKSVVFSIPTYTAKTAVTLVRSTLTALFSIPVYTIISGSMNYAASTLSATFSAITYTAKAGANALANTPTATFSVIVYAIGLGTRIIQSTLTATFTTAVLTKVGSIWTKVARNASGVWTRSNRNND